jgi:hypothetical protein
VQTSDILAAVNEEISRLEQVRNLLTGAGSGRKTASTATGFPFGGNKSSAPRRRHNISAAGRARIAAAQKARWAKMKKANSEKGKSSKK